MRRSGRSPAAHKRHIGNNYRPTSVSSAIQGGLPKKATFAAMIINQTIGTINHDLYLFFTKNFD